MADNLIRIAYLYEDLMNTYGDSGDVKILRYFLQKKGWQTQIDNISLGSQFNAADYDFVFFGGGQDYEQLVVSRDLPNKKDGLARFINDNKPMLAICGGYQLLGHYYIGANGEKIPGLGILDHYTLSQDNNRFIGDITIKNPETGQEYHGFENHNGRTFLGKDEQPLGMVVTGHGNNGEDHTEGAIYKSTYCSYFHGPILTRNGEIAKTLLLRALKNKYPDADFSNQEALKVKPTF